MHPGPDQSFRDRIQEIFPAVMILSSGLGRFASTGRQQTQKTDGIMKTIKNITILLAIFALTMPGAFARTFTNTAGKKIKAELVGMEDGAAILKLGHGRKTNVPLSSLSEEDQAYVKTWHEENKNKISKNDLELTIKKKAKRVSSSSSGGGGRGGRGGGGGGGRGGGGGGGKNQSSSKASKSETSYTCTLKNFSTKTVEGIEATYTIYKRVSTRGDGGSKTNTEEISDTIELEILKSRGTAEFVSNNVECLDSSQKSKNGPSQTRRESITGFVVTLSVDGKEILKQCHPENLLDRLAEEAKREEGRAKGRR
jgi:hypothetical protein